MQNKEEKIIVEMKNGFDSSGRSKKRREEEFTSSHFLYSRRQPSEKRRRTEEDSRRDIYGWSSNRRRIRRQDTDNNINYGRSSNRKRGRDDIFAGFHSSKSSSNTRRKREDSSSKNRRDASSGRSVIIKDDTISSSKCSINATPVVSFPCSVDDDVLTEILIRLPEKSIIRFKSVCKHWLYLITQDKNFIHLHSTRSKSHLKLLCISPEHRETKMRILSVNLSVKTSSGEGKVIIHNVKRFSYDQVLGPVNGLVCFAVRGNSAARIYNVSTREITPWIRSTLLDEENKYASEAIVSEFNPVYQIGFDPVKKEHKVFCFWRLSTKDDDIFRGFNEDSPGSYASWEALTVGRDTKWRRISVVPDENNSIQINEVTPRYCPVRNNVQANGCIYWRNKLMARDNGCIYWRNKLMARDSDFEEPWTLSEVPDYAPTEPDVIIAFDVGSEKFRIIPIPNFILDEPRETMYRPIAMLILGGRVTLIYPMSVNTVKLWMLDDGVDKQLKNCQGKGSSNWSAETITLDFHFRFYSFHEVTTSADSILISEETIDEYGEYRTVDCLYSYDLKTKTFKEIEMDGTLWTLPRFYIGRSLLTTFTGSLIPVRPQQNKVGNYPDILF